MKKNKENWTGILLLSFTIIFTCQLRVTRAEWGWPDDTDSDYFGGYPLRSEVTCDDYPVTLQCPGTDVIKIMTAEYGRQNKETCSALPSQMKNTACMLPEAFDIMSKECNNKTQCLLTVSRDVFPDPCPGTKKYLKTMFNCVKFMFGCEGSLSGIGEEIVSQVLMEPQRGTWVKDPLYETDHVFFAPFHSRQAQKLLEYDNWEDFLSGSPSDTYDLPSGIAEGNIVIFDRNLYYVKAKSRSIVKYSLMSRFRLRENVIPGQRSATGTSQKDKIMLASDEKALWVIYTALSVNRGNIIISKLNKEDLSVMETWKPLYSSHNVGHAFMICGIAYFVGATTGTIDYSYNTNLVKDKGTRVPEIEFDAYRVPAFGMSSSRKAPSHSRSRFGSQAQRRSFLRYNTTSISYNPRDRLLYIWDMTGANAVYYKLHYNDHDPEKPFVRTTPKTTTTTTTRRRIPTTTKRPFTKVLPPIVPLKPENEETLQPDRGTGIDFCDPVLRKNMEWPKTKAGETAKMPCSDGSQDYFPSWSLAWFYELPPPDAYEDDIDVATWTCVFDTTMRKAVWHVAGPDLSKCVTWATEIERRFEMGLIDNTEASSNLLTAIQQRTVDSEPLTDKVIITTSQVIKKLVDVKSFPSKEGAEKLVKSVTKTSSYLLSNEGSSEWKSMSDIKRTEIADELMTSVERAGFIYADTMAASPADVRDSEPLVVTSNDILMRVEVRERTLTTSQTSVTSFPSESNLVENWKDVNDVIQLSDSSIMSQRGVGPATVVFALYNNIGEFLTPTSSVWKPKSAVEEEKKTAQWKIDSRIISASFRDTSYKTKLDIPAVIIFEHKQESNHPHRCVYWDYSKSTNSGNWSDTGCRRTDGNRTHTTCECDHLTSFAVLVNHAGVTMEPQDDAALDIVTSVGISISIVCLLICIFTFSCFRNLKNDRNTIHIHLCICLLVAETIFLIGINQTQNEILCAVIAGFLHYSFLAAFLWMALEGFQLYVMLVEVFEGHSRWKWYYLTGYGIPAIIVGISAGIDRTGYGTDDVCWLKVDTGFIWSFVGPVCVVILSNLVFLSITVYKMYVHTMTFSDSAKINSIKAAVRGASVLLCLLGITWAFGILWINGDMPVLAYLFCVFNAFQGMFIFVFHCLLPRKVRQEYARCFNRFACCEKMSRDTYVSNSMSFSKQYTPGRYSNGTSAGTQQASLNRQSQLRRLWTETVAKPSESSAIVSDVNNVNTNRVTKSLSKEMAKMRGVALMDGYSTTSSILYFYPIDKKTNGVRSTNFRTEPRPPKPDKPSIIANYFKRNTIVVTDNSRSAGCRVATLPATKTTSDQILSNNNHNNIGQIRQQPPLPEDEVFLPAESGQDSRHQQAPMNQQENMALLHNADDIHFDHLQRHHHHHMHHQHPPCHPDQFGQAHFHPSKHAPPLPRHHHSSTVAHTHGVHDHPHAGHFPVASFSQSHIHDILDDSNVDPRFVDRRFDHPGRAPLPYWTDSPSGHQYQGSFEDSVNNAKRDSGISMQHPPNSMMHHQGDNQRPKIRRSQENITESVQQDSDSSNRTSSGFPASSRRYSNPVRNQDLNDGGVHPPKFAQHHHRHDPSYSEDEHHQQCFENNEKQHTGRNEPRRSSNQNPMLIPLNERSGKAVTTSGGHHRRRSLASSDSDDPIVTDCSVSSTGSSFGHPRTSLNRAGHNLTEERYYEEESYRNRRLPVTPQGAENPREQWYQNKGDKLQRTQSPQEDENDLEVEMITAPENEIENSRVVSSVASYQNQHESSTPPSSSGHSSDDRYVISPPAGYKSLAGGIPYSAAGNQGDIHRQQNRELPVRYYNRNSGHSTLTDHNTSSHQEPYRYIQRENSKNRTEDMVDMGGLRMMTNL